MLILKENLMYILFNLDCVYSYLYASMKYDVITNDFDIAIWGLFLSVSSDLNIGQKNKITMRFSEKFASKINIKLLDRRTKLAMIENGIVYCIFQQRILMSEN
jgi:hypothetical protein